MRLRLIMLLLIWGSFNTYLFAQDRKISMNVNRQPLPNVLEQIGKVSGYSIIYSDEIIQDSMLVTMKASRLSVSEILQTILPPKNLFYSLQSDNLIAIGSLLLNKQADNAILNTVITGKLIDEHSEPVNYANISIIDNSKKIIRSTTSDSLGRFKISYPYLPEAAIRITKVSYNIYESRILKKGEFDIGTIRLRTRIEALENVTVKTDVNEIEIKDGNIIYNLNKNIANHGTNLLDALKNVPGLSVENDNTILLYGKSGVNVQIDGRQQLLPASELAHFLRSMPANSVSAVEIINSPTAKNDASGSGSIINLKTNKIQLAGNNLIVNTGFAYGQSIKQNQEINYSGARKKAVWSIGYSHMLGYYNYDYGSVRYQNKQKFESVTDDVDKKQRFNLRLGVDYNLDRKNTIGVIFNSNIIPGGGLTDTQTEIYDTATNKLISVLSTINDYYKQYTFRLNENIHYIFKDSLIGDFSFDLDVGQFKKTNGNLQYIRYSTSNSDRTYRSLNNININLIGSKIDYVKKLKIGKIELGAKISGVATDNDAKFLHVANNDEILDENRTNRFQFNENIYAGYLNFSSKYKLFLYQVGIRAEQTNSTGNLIFLKDGIDTVTNIKNNYSNLFPNASISLPFKNSSYSISYSRRIDRPAYNELNPFIYLLDELSYWQGNPYLKPQYSNRFSVQYSNKSSLIVGVIYAKTLQLNASFTDTTEGNKIIMTTKNLGRQDHVALNVYKKYKAFKWWDGSINCTFYHLNNRNEKEYENMDLKRSAFRINLVQNLKLPGSFLGEITASYNSKRLAGVNSIYDPTTVISLGLQKNILKNKGTLRLAYTDILKGNMTNSTREFNGFSMRSYGYWEARQVKLNFTYKLSNREINIEKRKSSLETETERTL